jgi:hypothetical protein
MPDGTTFNDDPRSITSILLAHGLGHRPIHDDRDLGVHEVFSLNTMEVLGKARAEGALDFVQGAA